MFRFLLWFLWNSFGVPLKLLWDSFLWHSEWVSFDIPLGFLWEVLWSSCDIPSTIPWGTTTSTIGAGGLFYLLLNVLTCRGGVRGIRPRYPSVESPTGSLENINFPFCGRNRDCLCPRVPASSKFLRLCAVSFVIPVELLCGSFDITLRHIGFL